MRNSWKPCQRRLVSVWVVALVDLAALVSLMMLVLEKQNLRLEHLGAIVRVVEMNFEVLLLDEAEKLRSQLV